MFGVEGLGAYLGTDGSSQEQRGKRMSVLRAGGTNPHQKATSSSGLGGVQASHFPSPSHVLMPADLPHLGEYGFLPSRSIPITGSGCFYTHPLSGKQGKSDPWSEIQAWVSP